MRLARRMIEAITKLVVAESKTEATTPTMLAPGVWINTAMIDPGAAGARRPALKMVRVKMPTMPPEMVASRVNGFISTYGK